MNQIILSIILLDGNRLELKSTAGDIIKWESHFDLSITDLNRTTHLLYLAWLAVKREAKTSLDFEVWADTVKEISVSDPKA